MKSKFYVVVRAILFLPVLILLRTRMSGRENEPCREDGPYLLCANHQTALDPFFLCAALRRQQPHYMAKAELFRIPVIGFLLRKLGAYPVSRKGNDTGAVKHALSLLESGRSVAMFPQGTRCAGKPLRACGVKAGAGLIVARAGVQVLPVYIGMKDQKWRFLRRVRVVVGKPIPFEDFHYDKDAAGEYVRISAQIYEEICRLGEAQGT